MTDPASSVNASGWVCHLCALPVQEMIVRLQYQRTIFALTLPACPKCGMVLISEELATGKMAEAEQALEDK
jgi:hypothetical protein